MTLSQLPGRRALLLTAYLQSPVLLHSLFLACRLVPQILIKNILLDPGEGHVDPDSSHNSGDISEGLTVTQGLNVSIHTGRCLRAARCAAHTYHGEKDQIWFSQTDADKEGKSGGRE